MTVPKFIRVFLGGLGEIGGPEETKQRMALDRQVFALPTVWPSMLPNKFVVKTIKFEGILCCTSGFKPNLMHQTGLLNSPKTKMINGIMLAVFPCPFVQASLWRCNLEATDWIVLPGAWVPNPPNADGCTPVAFWGSRFGKIKALLRKQRHQHLLVGDPLNSAG